jgi:hypothetical protein
MATSSEFVARCLSALHRGERRGLGLLAVERDDGRAERLAREHALASVAARILSASGGS